MAATTQEEILSGILPRVSIEKITLNNPSNNLEIDVELNIREVLDNNFFGSWFDDINIKKYILIDVVQSSDPQITQVLSFSNDMIQLCNLSRAKQRTQDMRMKVFSYLTGKKKLKQLLETLETKTTRKTISLAESTRRKDSAKNYPSYTNSDGQKVYEISYRTKFTLENNIQPEHLAYFAVCSIDLQSLCSDLKIDYDIAESFEENGKVVSEIVIENSKIAGYSYVYVDANGVAWSGPVHQNNNGEWRSGDEETPDSITLSKITVSNTKVQDFRNFVEIQRMILDFNQRRTKQIESIKETLNKVTKIQSVDFKPEKMIPQFTEIFSSIDSNGNVKFLFGAEFVNILKTYSKFSKLYDSVNETFKMESISNTKILDLKLYRRRVKNHVLLNNSIAINDLQKMDENEPDELILQTRDKSWKSFIDLNDEKASIREANLVVDDNDFTRYFTGIDKTFKNLTDGVYQYYLEFEIEDGALQVVKDQLYNLSLAKNQLIEYYNKITQPPMRKFLLESQNPHIDSPRETSNNSVITDYGYDIASNKLSPLLINRLIREYEGINSTTSPWINSVSIFVIALDIFSESIQTNEDRTRLVDFLHLTLNPNSTNPSIISKIIELIDYFISSLTITFDINLENILDASPASSLNSRVNKSFKITKYFNEVFDSNSLKLYNIDYLSTSANQSINNDGLLSINKNKLSERISNEMLKFFNTESPNINFSQANDNFENLKYSFLTPSRLDFRDRSFIFSGVEEEAPINQNRTLQYFYNEPNQYEKAISIYADILNFKLDVTAKNRQRFSNKTRDRANLTDSERAAAKRREEIYTSRKINDLFADFGNLTVQRFRTTDSEVVLGNSNIKSLNNLMSSFSSGAIRNKQSNNVNKIISNTEIDFVKELVTINPSNIRIIRGNIVLGFSKPFSISRLSRIPNQIRALIFKPQNELSVNIVNNLNYTEDFKTYIKNKTINYFNFEMLAEVEYLSGFEKVKGTDEVILTNPIWKRLNKEYIDRFTRETEILCRLKCFQNQYLNIRPSSEIEKRYYDKYFIINTSEIVQTEQESALQQGETVASINPLIENFLGSLRKSFPDLRIKETSGFTSAFSMIPAGIEIVANNGTGDKQIIDIKNIKDIVARDINKNTDIKIGKPITPASAFIAAQTLSLGLQEVSINNKHRSSNHVSSRNIKKVTSKNKTNMNR